MKRLLLSSVTLFVGFGVFPLSALAQVTPNPENKTLPTPEVVISEICYWPKKGEPEWVELANVSDRAVDIKGWQLLDGQSLEFTVSEKSLSMPPKSYLVVKLDGSGQAPIPFTQNKSVAHSPRGVVGNLLGDKGGHLALYSNNPVESTYKIRDYVAWGRSPGRVIADAMIVGLWLHPQDVVFGSSLEPWVGVARKIQQGGSIGVVESTGNRAKEKWAVFTPEEVNPGQSGVGKREPTVYFPIGGKTSEDGTATLSVIPMEEGIKYQFQVCVDKMCQQVFLDVTQSHPEYILEKPIPKNTTYYWHARLIYPNKSTSRWTELRTLTNGYPR